MDQKPLDQNVTSNAQPQAQTSKPAGSEQSVFMQIKRITAWVMIISAVTFALIGILAIWQVFGDDAGDVIWRAFSSLLIIAFAALVVNVASRAAESKH